MRDKNIWQEQLLDEIATIASKSTLADLWSGINPDRISSYEEEVSHIFDDFEIDAFLLEVGPSLSCEKRGSLENFRKVFWLFTEYADQKFGKQPAFDEILEDPRWAQVMAAAQRVVDLS